MSKSPSYTVRKSFDPTTESNLEKSNVYANARFAKLRKKSRKRRHYLHDNHPLFDFAAELCFESVQ